MRYAFTIEESDVPPKRDRIEFNARGDERAFRFLVRHILLREENRPLRKGTLHRQGAFGWEEVMIWQRGPGWSFPGGRQPDIIDKRPAPGA